MKISEFKWVNSDYDDYVHLGSETSKYMCTMKLQHNALFLF